MEVLGTGERAVGGNDGDRQLDHRLVDAPDELGRADANGGSDDAADADDANEIEHGVAHRRVPAGGKADDDGEEHDAGAVIDQAFAFDDQRQPLRRAQALEHCHDRDRIGGDDERGEHHGVDEPEPLRERERVDHRRQHGGGDREGHDDAGHRQRVDGDAFAPEAGRVEMERRFEDEPRQDQREEELLGEVRWLEGMRSAKHETGNDQRDGVGQAQPPRANGDRRSHDEQQDECEFAVHVVPFPIVDALRRNGALNRSISTR